LLLIVEAPDGENVAKFALAVSSLGNVRTQTARAWPESEFMKLISELPNALDAAAVKAAVGRIRPDAVINELTSLPRHYAPAEMKAAAERDRTICRRRSTGDCVSFITASRSLSAASTSATAPRKPAISSRRVKAITGGRARALGSADALFSHRPHRRSHKERHHERLAPSPAIGSSGAFGF
jgi:hypothetical protein